MAPLFSPARQNERQNSLHRNPWTISSRKPRRYGVILVRLLSYVRTPLSALQQDECMLISARQSEKSPQQIGSEQSFCGDMRGKNVLVQREMV